MLHQTLMVILQIIYLESRDIRTGVLPEADELNNEVEPIENEEFITDSSPRNETLFNSFDEFDDATSDELQF